MSEIKLENLKKSFGKTDVIHDFSIDVKDGELIVIVGPSGCGKSTLLRMVAGLEDANQGNIFIDGKKVNELEPMERNIAMVFQNYALYPHMSVFGNMAYGLKIAKIPKDEINSRVQKAANILELGELLERKPSQLSGGQRQRVAMGRALVRDPKVFLFDEPLSNLDAKLRVEMRREIKKLHQKLKTTIVYVTHDQTEAMSLGTRIAIMNHGVIQQCEKPEIIYKKPQNVFVADFIGSPSMNLIEGHLIKNGADFSFECENSKGASKILIKNYNFKNQNIRNNQEVLFGVRPEHMYLSKSSKNEHEMKLKTILSEYIGHEQIITFNYFGQELLGKFPSSSNIPMNKELNLFFDLDQISLFDQLTEERL